MSRLASPTPPATVGRVGMAGGGGGGGGGRLGAATTASVSVESLLLQLVTLSAVERHVHTQEEDSARVATALEEALERRERRVRRRQAAAQRKQQEGGSAAASEGDSDAEDERAEHAAAAAFAPSPVTPLSPGSPPVLFSPPASGESDGSLNSASCTVAAARRRDLAARRENLQRLAAKIAADEAEVRAMRNTVLQRRQALLPRLALMQQLQTASVSHREQLQSARRRLHADLAVELRQVEVRCDFRRRAMLQQVLSIYPISPPRPPGHGPTKAAPSAAHPLVCYTIRGLRLPNNFNNILTSFDEEQVSTALGYVCHLVLMLSKYLEVSQRTCPLYVAASLHSCCCSLSPSLLLTVRQVPLRYRLLFRGSRSVVCDDVTASSQFPLYFKNMEERRFELGVILLNKNIEQIISVRMPSKSPYASHVRENTFTLQNLDALFKHELAL